MRNGSTVRKRQLARQLRLLREEAGMTIETAAPLLDWSSSKLSRIENAHQPVDVHGVRSMLDLYGVGGGQWTELVTLAREARQRGWWRTFGLDDKGYVPLEAEASLVRDFTITYVPGLLQTADYAKALFTAGLDRRSDAQLESAVTVRMIRQERLLSEEQPLELIAIVEESALRRPVGNPAILCAQLEHIIAATGLDTVTFQVLPSTLGAYPGLTAAFTLLSFGDLGEPDIAYVEHPMGAVHIEKENEVARATLVFDHLRTLALSPAASVDLVERVIAQL